MKTKKFFLVLLVALSFIITSCGVGPAVKELKKYNTPTSRYWIDFIKKNGINAIDSDGDLLLVAATLENNFPLVKACIKSGADVNRYVKGYYPAIYYAVRDDYSDIARLLVKNKAVVRSEDFDCFQLLVQNQKDVSSDTIDTILSVANKNMLDYSSSKVGIFYNAYFIYNLYLFENLYKKGYKPSASDYRRFIEIWYEKEDMYEDKKIKEICKKILISCKNTNAAKRVNPVFNFVESQEFDTSEERRFEFLKFQVENGAAIKVSEKEFEKQFKSNEDDFIKALKYFSNQDNLAYIFELLKNSGDNNIEIDQETKDSLLAPCISSKDYEKLEFCANQLIELRNEPKINDKIKDSYEELGYIVPWNWNDNDAFVLIIKDVYEKSSHEEFEKCVSEVERILGQNCKGYFIDYMKTHGELLSVEEKCGLTRDIRSNIYDVAYFLSERELGIKRKLKIKYSDIIGYSKILDSVIEELDWFKSLGFSVKDEYFQKYKDDKDSLNSISQEDFEDN